MHASSLPGMHENVNEQCRPFRMHLRTICSTGICILLFVRQMHLIDKIQFVVPKKNADEYEEYMQFVLSARVWEVIAKRASAFIAYADRDGAEKAAAEVPESL